MATVEVAPVALVESRILVIRAQKVLLDSDLAALYQVETGALNRAVRRNSDRFPDDFMFQLTPKELESLRCQFGISNEIMRTFVRLRQLLATHEELARRLDQLEWRQSEQDGRVQYVFETIQSLIEAPAPTEAKRSIGFPTSGMC
jgi:hypothetical protein